jgi:hypothetical protein
MGRNRELRKKIAAQQKVVEAHEEKIRQELMKPIPNESYVLGGGAKSALRPRRSIA